MWKYRNNINIEINKKLKMALQGKYTHKGLDIADAYIVIKDVNSSSGYQTISELKTEAESKFTSLK